MKYIINFIIAGLLIGTLISCSHTNHRKVSGDFLPEKQDSYGQLKNEIVNLLETTRELKHYKVAQPEIL